MNTHNLIRINRRIECIKDVLAAGVSKQIYNELINKLKQYYKEIGKDVTEIEAIPFVQQELTLEEYAEYRTDGALIRDLARDYNIDIGSLHEEYEAKLIVKYYVHNRLNEVQARKYWTPKTMNNYTPQDIADCLNIGMEVKAIAETIKVKEYRVNNVISKLLEKRYEVASADRRNKKMSSIIKASGSRLGGTK